MVVTTPQAAHVMGLVWMAYSLGMLGVHHAIHSSGRTSALWAHLATRAVGTTASWASV